MFPPPRHQGTSTAQGFNLEGRKAGSGGKIDQLANKRPRISRKSSPFFASPRFCARKIPPATRKVGQGTDRLFAFRSSQKSPVSSWGWTPTIHHSPFTIHHSPLTMLPALCVVKKQPHRTRLRVRGISRGLCVFQHFFDGRQSLVDRAESVVAERDHPEFNRFLLHHHGRSALVDQFAQRVADVEQFVDALA